MKRKSIRRKSIRRKSIRRKSNRRKNYRMSSRRNKLSRKSKLKKNKKTSRLIYKGGMKGAKKKKPLMELFIPVTEIAPVSDPTKMFPTMPNNDELMDISNGVVERSGVLGRGASGEVYRFSPGPDCIIKKYTGSGKAGAIDEINVLLEIEKLKNIPILEGKNWFEKNCFEKIIQFCNNYKYARDMSGENIYISLKYGGESLKNFIESDKNSKELDGIGPIRLNICNGLSEAIKCFHRMGFIHRDLKPANIILDPDNLQPILIDFGSTASIPRSEGPLQEGTLDLLKAEERMTKVYMPPIELTSDVDDGTLFCRGCFYDMWALLVIITEMVISNKESLYQNIFSISSLTAPAEHVFEIQTFSDEKGNDKFNKLMGDFKTEKIHVKWNELFDVNETSIIISGTLPLEEVSISSLLDDPAFTGEDFLLK